MHIAKKHQARIVRKTQNPRAPQSAVNLTIVKGIHTMKLHIGYPLPADRLCRQAAAGARAAQNKREYDQLLERLITNMSSRQMHLQAVIARGSYHLLHFCFCCLLFLTTAKNVQSISIFAHVLCKIKNNSPMFCDLLVEIRLSQSHWL